MPTTSLTWIAGTHFLFEEIQQMASITLNRKHVEFVWTDKFLDATVIEISQDLAALYSSYGAVFLQMGEVKQDADVVILQYPSGTFSIADGKIEAVNGSKIFYKIGTERGSSGSPLLDLECSALAIHHSGIEGINSSDPNAIRTATALSAVVREYLNDRTDLKTTSRVRGGPLRRNYLL